MASVASTPRVAPFAEVLHIDHGAVEAGVPLETFASFIAGSGIEWKDAYHIIIPARTLKHRRARSENLSADESDKFARLVRVFDTAVRVFGNMEKALRWLTKPKQRFHERTPLNMLSTEVGARLVEEMLGQIDHGIFA